MKKRFAKCGLTIRTNFILYLVWKILTAYLKNGLTYTGTYTACAYQSETLIMLLVHLHERE
jgi:hypothetical protein